MTKSCKKSASDQQEVCQNLFCLRRLLARKYSFMYKVLHLVMVSNNAPLGPQIQPTRCPVTMHNIFESNESFFIVRIHTVQGAILVSVSFPQNFDLMTLCVH